MTPPKSTLRRVAARLSLGITGLFLLIALMPGCRQAPDGSGAISEPTATGDVANVTTNASLRFAVTGMHCDGCAAGVRSELMRTPGVRSADVSFESGEAVVACDTNRATAPHLIGVIVEAGYQARLVP
ncbi:MAG: heavy-metal-associated domain-containing protein [Limisphaerales bacterium]